MDAPELYDTTLRDGTQQEGISPTVTDKLRVAAAVDRLGVGCIEGGWPGANPKDTEFFQRAAAGDLQLRRAALVAFGMTRRPGRDAAIDPGLAALLAAATPVVTLVAKASPWHVTGALGATLDENLAMVADSVALLRADARRVVLDAEHYVDGHGEDASYALAVLPVRVTSYRAVTARTLGDDPGAPGGARAEAEVAVELDGERRRGSGTGNGPLDALDAAFRAAVAGRLPGLYDIALVDYAVRIVDGRAGTGATTRVHVTARGPAGEYTTVGVSTDVVDASWRALADAYDYGLWGGGLRPRGGPGGAAASDQ